MGKGEQLILIHALNLFHSCKLRIVKHHTLQVQCSALEHIIRFQLSRCLNETSLSAKQCWKSGGSHLLQCWRACV